MIQVWKVVYYVSMSHCTGVKGHWLFEYVTLYRCERSFIIWVRYVTLWRWMDVYYLSMSHGTVERSLIIWVCHIIQVWKVIVYVSMSHGACESSLFMWVFIWVCHIVQVWKVIDYLSMSNGTGVKGHWLFEYLTWYRGETSLNIWVCHMVQVWKVIVYVSMSHGACESSLFMWVCHSVQLWKIFDSHFQYTMFRWKRVWGFIYHIVKRWKSMIISSKSQY